MGSQRSGEGTMRRLAVLLGSAALLLPLAESLGHHTPTMARYLLTMAAMATAGPAQAQTLTTFLSTLEQPEGGDSVIATESNRRDLRFTTGSDPYGYTLHSIILSIRDNSGAASFDFDLHAANANGSKGAKIVDLNGSVGGFLSHFDPDREVTFTPARATRLRPSTNYFLSMISRDSQFGGLGGVGLSVACHTGNDAVLDDGAAAGWSLGTLGRFPFTGCSNNRSLKLAIRGSVREASTDATLSALTLQNAADDAEIALSPAFDAAETAYAVSVAHGVKTVTVTPTLSEEYASFAYLDADDQPLADADGDATNGQQAALAVGDNVIKVRVTAEDGVTTGTYTLTVTRAPIRVSIAADSATITEGEEAVFTLTRTGDTSESLPVRIRYNTSTRVAEGFDVAKFVTGDFAAGQSTVKFRVRSRNDQVQNTELNRFIRATVINLSDDEDIPRAYEIGSPSQASVTVTDDDLPLIIMTPPGISFPQEGQSLDFVFTRQGALALQMDVTLEVTETGQMIAGNAPTSVRFGSGQRQVTLSIATDDDSVHEGRSLVTVRILQQDPPRYTVGVVESISIQVLDNDAAGPLPWQATFTPRALHGGDGNNIGCDVVFTNDLSTDCLDAGQLTTAQFQDDGRTYRIDEFYLRSNNTLRFKVVPALPGTLRDRVTLQVGDRSFPLAESREDVSGEYEWDDSGSAWSVGTSLEVGLADVTQPRLVSIIRQDPMNQRTNADSLTWRVTFSEEVNAGVDKFQILENRRFSDDGATVSDGSFEGGRLFINPASVTSVRSSPGAAIYDVLFNDPRLAQAHSEFSLSLRSPASIVDGAGNALGPQQGVEPSERSYVLDNRAPTLEISGVPPTSNAPFDVTFEFSEPVSGFTLDDIAVDHGSVSEFMAVDEAVYTVKITPQADGIININVAAGVAEDLAGNPNSAAAASSRYDETAPTVTSIERQVPETSPTGEDVLIWRVTFSEPVENVDPTDFRVSGTTATLNVTEGTPVTENWYLITASGGDLAGLNGTVNLSFASDQDIQDAVGNPLTATAPTGTNDNSYRLDNTAPRVTSIRRRNPTDSLTNADSLTWRVTFSEDVRNVDEADFMVSRTTATLAVTAATAARVFDVTATGGDLADLDDTVTLSFASGQDIQDAVGNPLTATAPTGTNDNSYELDNTAPTVTFLDVPAISTEPFHIRARFSERVNGGRLPTGFVVENATLSNLGVTTFVGAPDYYWRFLVTPTADGDVTLDFPANAVTDDAGNGNEAAAQAMSFYDGTAPTVLSIVRQDPETSPTDADSLTWRVTFSEDVADVDHTDFTLSGTTAPLSVEEVTGETGVWDVTASGGDLAGLDGTVTLSFDSDQNIRDAAGNALTATAPTGANDNSYRLDNTPPSFASASVNGAELEITFSEELDETATPAADAFTVQADSSPVTVSGVAVSGARVTLTLADTAAAGQMVTVAYTQPATDPVLRDPAGNPAESFAAQTANNSIGNNPPVAANPIPDQTATTGSEFSYAFPENAFTDPDGHTLTYTALQQGDDTALPAWLEFDAGTRTFSGTPPDGAEGQLTLKVTADDGNGGRVSDEFTLTVTDGIAPRVASITRFDPTTSPTNETSLFWVVTFSEPVTNVDAADFQVTGTSVTPNVVPETGDASYIIQVLQFHLLEVNNPITLTLADDQSIEDRAGNALTNTTPAGANENTYVFDNTAPTVTITGVPGTTSAPFEATISFSEVVSGFAVEDITAENATLSAFTASTSTPGTVWTVVVTPTADGEVTLSIAADVATDEAGNGNTAAPQATSTYTAPNTPPTSANGELSVREDVTYAPVPSQFTFNDDDGDSLHSVIITALPAAGMGELRSGCLSDICRTLTESDLPFTVLPSTMDDGDFDYNPPANANGDNFATFQFKVNDGTEDSTDEYTMTINITPVNDAPTVDNPIADQTVTVGETFNFTVPEDAFDDVDTGDTLTYTARLDDDSTLPSWLTFTTATFMGTPGATDAGTITVKVTATDSGNAGVSDEFEIVVVAAEQPRVIVTPPTDSSLNEGSGTATYTLKLTTDPGSTTVTIVPSSGDSSAVSLSPTRLTFTTSDWDTAQAVTLTGVEDADGDSETVTISHSVSGYGSVSTAPDVTVSVMDNDTAGLTVEPTSVDVDEGGTTTYAVTLATQPGGNVTITPSSGDSSAVSLSPARLTFTTSDWDTAQTVTLTGVAEDGDSEDETVTISHGVSGYEGVSVGDVVTVSVNDAPRVVSIERQTPPTSPTNADELVWRVTFSETVSSASLTELAAMAFTVGGATGTDINVVQIGVNSGIYEVTISGGNLAALDGTVTLGFADGHVIIDDLGNPLTTTIPTGTDERTYELDNTAPTVSYTAPATLTVGTAIAAIAPATTDSDIASYRVTGLPAGLAINTTTGEISGTPTTASAAASTVTVTVTDNAGNEAEVTRSFPMVAAAVDPGVGVTPPADGSLAEGGTLTYTMTLNTQPSGPVTINPSSGDGSVVSLSPTSLTFTTVNWSTAQTVTVTAVEDDVDTGNRTVTISHSVSGYATITSAAAVTVTVTDNDTAGVSVTPPSGGDLNEGQTRTYTLQLDTQPSGPVTIVPSSGDGSVVSLSPASLTFTASDWDTAQTVTLTAVEDDVDTGNQTVTVSHDVNGYGSVSSADPVTVTVTDNDTAGVSVTPPTGGGLNEGQTRTYTLQLDTQPSGPVTIVPSSGDGSVVSLSPASLTFTASDWDTAQTVTLTAVEDDVDTGNQTVTISHDVSGYGSVSSADPVTVTVTDDDTAGVSVTPPSGGGLNEGQTRTYTLQLDTQPSGPVTIVPSSGDSSAVSVSPTSLTFTASDWDTAQTVTVTAVEDDVDTGNQTVTISHDVNGYGSVSSADPVTVTVTDDDTAGVSVTPPSGGDLNEGQTRTYTLQLNTQPSGPVTIVPSSGDSSAVSVSPTSLTFTASDWDTAQTVTVTAVEDDVDTGNQTVTISHSVSGYGSVSSADPVTVTVTDDDTAGVSVTPPTGGGLNEGQTRTYTLQLDTQPSGPVTIVPSSGDSSAVSVSPTSLTFTASDWDTAQTVTVTAVDDDVDTGNQTVTISHDVSGYGSVSSADPVTVTVTDNDTAGVSVTPPSGGDLNEGQTRTYTVRLNTQPSGPVTIVPSSGDSSAVSLSPASLTFTTSDWDTAQTVTLTAVEDDMDTGNQTVTISHDVSGYGSVSSADPVTVTVTDNDTAGVSVTPPSGGDLNEGQTRTYTLQLNTQPSGPATIVPSSGDSSAVSLSPASLTFTTSDWDTAQTVTLTAVDDDVDTGNQTVTISHSVSGYGSVTSANSVTVTVMDNDTAGVSVTPPSGGGLNEGQTRTYTLQLDTQPSGPVTIVPSSGDSSAVSVSPTSLTFTASDWDTAQTVTVTAVEDDVDTGNQTVTISHDVSGYGSISSADPVTVTVTDDDTAGVSVTPPSGGGLNEGQTRTYTLQLDTQPSGPVTIVPSSGDSSAVSLSPTSLTFTASDWDTAQTVTLTAVEDDMDTGNQTVTVSHGVNGYGSVTSADSVTVTVTDDDTAGVSVTPPTGGDLNEGQTRTYTLQLDTQPSGPVTIVPSSGDGSVVSLSPASLTFTASDWDTAQAVTVTAVDDDVDTGNQTVTISHSVSGYGSVTSANSVTVTVMDNDTAGVSVTPPSGGDLNEGQTRTYTLQLNTQPSGPVTIVPSSGDSSAVSLSPTSLTFTASDWDTAQTVTVTAVDDDVDTGNQTVTISHDVSGYGSVSSADPVTVTVTDDDTAGVSVTPPTGGGLNEGQTRTYTLQLDTQPSGPVTIVPSSGDSDAVSLSPTSLTFTPSDWDTAQTVTVTAVDDDVDTGNQTVTISHDVSGYGSVTSANSVTVTVMDNDTAGVSVTPPSGGDLNEGQTRTYTLQLNTQPNGPVTIVPSSGDSSAVSLSPASLTFTASDWDTAQTVTLTAVEDDVDTGNQTVTISHSVSGYGSVSSADPVTVTVMDNDAVGVSVSITRLTVGEANSGSYTLQLNTQPGGAVTITPSSSDSGALSVSPASLTFTTSDWDTAQTMTLVGVEDADGDSETVTISHSVSGYDSVTSANAVTVTVTDNDTAGVSVEPASVDLDEGGTITYTVTLSTQPGGNVTITPTSGDSSAVSVASTSLTFTPSDWDTARTVTVTGVAEDGDTDDETVTISHSVDGYAGVSVGGVVTVSVNDAGDTVAPRVSSITRPTATTAALETNADTLIWRVTFSEAVANVDAADFMVTGSTATVTSVEPVGGQQRAYDVTAAGGDLAALNGGPVRLVFDDAQDIEDLAGNALGSTMPTVTNDNAYLLDNTAPRVTFIKREQPSASRTNANILTWHVRFSEEVLSTGDDDFMVSGSTAMVTDISGDDGINYTVTISGGDLDDVNGEVGLGFATDHDIQDVAGNRLTITTPTEGAVEGYEVDNTVTIAYTAPEFLSLGTAITITPTTADTDITSVSATGLPAGLTIDGSDGGISGTPTTASAAPSEATVTVTDDLGNSVEVPLTFPAVVAPRVRVDSTNLSPIEGETHTYTLVLDTPPSGPVTIIPSSSDSSAVSVEPASLTFTPSDWSARPVMVTAVDDEVDSGNRTVTISHSVSGYGAITVGDVVTVAVTDNDAPAVNVQPTSEDLDEGGTFTYTVTLTLQPSGPVTIIPSSSDSSAVSVEPASLTFTPSDWSARPVMVTAVDDEVDSGNRTVTISHSVSGYGAITVGDVVTVAVTDNDAPAVNVQPTSEDLDEGGTFTYTVTLTLQPSGPVTIIPSSSDSSAVSVEPASLTFTPSDWSARPVMVTAVDDEVDSGNRTVTISHSVSGYGAITVGDVVTVAVTDNDAPAVNVQPTSEDLDEGGTFTYTVTLTLQPSGPVTITPTSSDSEAVSIFPASLTFTPSDWSARPVMVTAVDDAIDTGNQTVTISHSVSGYDGITTANAVTVTVAEDDAAGVTVTPPTGGNLDEGGTLTYTVTLNTEPGGPVTITPTSSDSSAVSVEPASLTFTPSDWSARPVTVTAVDDAIDTGNQTVTISHSVSGYDAITTADAVTVTVTDDDGTPPTDTTAPTVDYTVPTSLTVGTAITTITPSTRDSDITSYGATGLPDGLSIDAATGEISGTPTTVSTAPATVGVTVTDNVGNSATVTLVFPPVAAAVQPGVKVTPNSLTINEGSTAGYTVTLATPPVGNVTITAASGDSGAVGVEPASLVFTPSNWAADQTVSVTARQDTATGNETVTISHNVSGYGSLTTADAVTVSVTDTGRRDATATREVEAQEEAEAVLNEVVVPDVVQQLAARTTEDITSRLNSIASGSLGGLPTIILDDALADTFEFLYGQRERLKDGSLDWRQAVSGRTFAFPLSGLNFAQGEEGASTQDNPFSTLAVWGGGHYASYRNIIEDTDVDGSGFSGVIGMDLQPIPRLTTGLALTTTRWGLDYATDARDARAEGTYEVGITLVNPYVNWSATDQLSLWATFGYGRGEVEQNPEEGNGTTRTDGFTIRAGGLRFQVLPGIDPLTGEGSPFGLALKVDGATSSFLGTQVQLARLAAEVSRSFAVENSLLTAALDLGWRIRSVSGNDDPDAQQQAIADKNDGGGAELAGRLNWRNTEGSVSATVDTRVLLGGGHHREWGMGGQLRLTPSHRDGEGDGEGLSLTLQPSFGVTGTRLDALWSLSGDGDLAVNNDRPGARLDAQLAYSFRHHGALFTPYTEMAWEEATRTCGAGLRYHLNPSLELDLNGAHRSGTNGTTESRFSLRVNHHL